MHIDQGISPIECGFLLSKTHIGLHCLWNTLARLHLVCWSGNVFKRLLNFYINLWIFSDFSPFRAFYNQGPNGKIGAHAQFLTGNWWDIKLSEGTVTHWKNLIFESASACLIPIFKTLTARHTRKYGSFCLASMIFLGCKMKHFTWLWEGHLFSITCETDSL